MVTSTILSRGQRLIASNQLKALLSKRIQSVTLSTTVRLSPTTNMRPFIELQNISTLTNNNRFNSYRHNTDTIMRSFSDKSTEGKEENEEVKEEEEEEETKKTTSESESDAAVEDEEEEEEISREEELENEVKDLKNQLLRTLAEQENTRRIAKQDVESARNFAIKSFAKGLLDVSDNLSRALDAVPEELRTATENDNNTNNNVLATLYEGIHMTEKGLTKAFESNGLIKFGKVGDVFDPNVHNAMFEYPDPEKKPGSVGQVIKVGFYLNDRVLRPAEVGVVKKA